MDIEEDDGFHSLDEEDKMFDEIKQEILDEEMKWICEQDIDYNIYLQHLQNNSIECPVCHTGNLIKTTINTISCDVCHTSIQTFLEIDALKNNMENTAAEHSCVCQSPIECIVFPTPYDNSMFMLCNICQFLFQIS
uniref:RPA-interacting protein C-terminal domain-containing protein n=1 Tax=Schizaphis graminum TaxID=13262 RepID=A0A2S2PRR4_SCHGA